MNTATQEKNSITVKDVALKAGVALGTVSRYLNGHNLNEDTRLKVYNAIQELDYKQNFMARGIRSKKSMTIGVLISNYKEIFQTSIVSSLEHILEENNYGVMVLNYEGNNEKLYKKLQFLKERLVDGIIVFPYKTDEKINDLLKRFMAEETPVIVIDNDIPGLQTDKVLVDNISASFRAIEHLIHNNHKRIAVIAGSDESNVSCARLKGYKECLITYGIPYDMDLVRYGYYTKSGGYLAAKELLLLENRPTAIFTGSYHMTYGALIAIHEMKISIPGEISIIGFDYTDFSDVIVPALTSIEQPTERMGEMAADLILKRMKGNYEEYPCLCQIPTRMLLNDSVKVL